MGILGFWLGTSHPTNPMVNRTYPLSSVAALPSSYDLRVYLSDPVKCSACLPVKYVLVVSCQDLKFRGADEGDTIKGPKYYGLPRVAQRK